MTRVSVIVPVYNGRELLGPCLAAIRDGEGLAEGDLEVIVVDDGSTDGSAEAAAGLCDKLVKMDHNRGAAAARNQGAREAAADLLVFVDVDVIIKPVALKSLGEAFVKDEDLAAAVGRYTGQPAAPGLINLYHNAFTRYHHDLSPQEIDWFWGALGAVKKEALFAVGGFDERYQGASAEDMELGRALAEAGHKILYCPEAEGAHAHNFSLKGMLVNDYKKAVLGMKLKLMDRLPRRAPGFANPRNIATLPLLLASLFFFVAFLATMNKLILGAGFISALLLYLAGKPYYQYLSRHFSRGLVWGVLLYWLQIAVIVSGAAAGALGRLLGRSPYGKPGWI